MASFIHKPIMVEEVCEGLRVKPDTRIADGTLGGAGHAAAILRANAPNGWLYGCDRDGVALEAARAKLAEFADRIELRRGNYDELATWIPKESCDGVLLDLGVSSPQLDQAGRGFSFQQDGPLDMRMDTRQALTAETLVNESSAKELAKIFWELGDEREANRIARAIETERQQHRIMTTRQLADLVERVKPRAGRKTHPATNVFLALRMSVNDELGHLRRGLEAAMEILKPGGRLAVLTFHSIEDRMVKEFGRAGERDYTVSGPVDVPELRQPRTPLLKRVNRKAITASEAELEENPRARSAQLRVMEKWKD